MEGTLALAGALAGLVIGSFINVVAYRVPRGESVVHPRSTCPACGHEIRSRDNVPVVSWLLLRGRCRDCGASISARYPLVEAGTALLFVATAFVIGASWTLPAYWWFAAVTFTLVLTDLDHKRIPNRILYPGIVVGAGLLAMGAALDGSGTGGGFEAYLRGLGGALGYFVFLFVIALLARGGFGFGDVKLAFLLGLFLAYQSWSVLIAGVFLAFVIGGLVALGLLLSGRRGRKDAIPFGPSLVAGAYVALAYGAEIADWYTGL